MPHKPKPPSINCTIINICYCFISIFKNFVHFILYCFSKAFLIFTGCLFKRFLSVSVPCGFYYIILSSIVFIKSGWLYIIIKTLIKSRFADVVNGKISCCCNFTFSSVGFFEVSFFDKVQCKCICLYNIP